MTDAERALAVVELLDTVAISPVGRILLLLGAMCPACHHGTRVTSKRWARCKRCGERVQRRTEEEASAMLTTASA